MTVRVAGVVSVSLANESVRPGGELFRAMFAVRGSRRTVSVALRPACRSP